MKKEIIKGYKVFTPDFKAKQGGYQYAENTEFTFDGKIQICASGFHFCTKAADCFNYYDFNPDNIVCQVEARGNTMGHDQDSKVCTDILFVGRKLSWLEVLDIVNIGKWNTGHSNTGNRNTGNWNTGNSNTGDWNTGDWNTGDWNTGNWNTGYRNTGNSNTGNRNTGNSNTGDWNTGNRNTGDSNTGYRSGGAFCVEENPMLILFDKLTNIPVREWEEHRAVELMKNLSPVIWVQEYVMTDDEKKQYPTYETIGGYYKSITMHEAWSNLWGNLDEDDKQVFITLPNFDADKFEHITGIKIVPVS